MEQDQLRKDQKVILFEADGNFKFPRTILHDYHTHLFCHRGSAGFNFNDTPFSCKAGEFVFWFAKSQLGNILFSKNFKATILCIAEDFLNDNMPDQNWSIDAMLHSREHPVLHLNDKKDKEKVLSNFRLLHDKFQEREHRFYEAVLKLHMQIFLLEMWHSFANEYERRKRTLQSGTLYERFLHMVQLHCMNQREVKYYALQLHITAKYLNYICKQNSGVSASEWIQRYTKERLIILLQNKHLNIAEIADEMAFASRSYFTRYVKKILGATPSEYRNRMG